MAEVYILSTLSADQRYTGYRSGGADLPVAERSVFIKGGANVADRRLITPQGVVTKVTAEDYEFLQTVEVFQTHVTNGYITVSTSRPADPDAAAASQESRSPDSPLVEQDFAEGKAPIAGGSESSAQASVPAGRSNSRRA